MQTKFNMPETKRYRLEAAQRIAEGVVALLAPHCERIKIAGSIRRLRETVKDIEIVCIPKRDVDGRPDARFTCIVETWEKVKGTPYGKYTQRILASGIKLDLFMCRRENWGLIFAIRTGPAEYSHQSLARAWYGQGFKSIDGMLTKKGISINIYEERQLFSLLKITYLAPPERGLATRDRPNTYVEAVREFFQDKPRIKPG